MPRRFTRVRLQPALEALTSIRDHCLELEQSFRKEIALAAPDCQASARNLIHYLALRRHDLRELQRPLTQFGLSSLGRLEANTLAGLHAVILALKKLSGFRLTQADAVELPVDFQSGPALLSRRTEELLGSAGHDVVHIMVTMPPEAATHYVLVRDLVVAGMDVMRINCAHDNENAWRAMIANLRRAEREIGRNCRVMMDLGGPKLRTGALAGGTRMVRWRPKRNFRGAVVAPARILLVAGQAAAPAGGADAMLPVPARLLAMARRGDTLRLTDARRKVRNLKIVETAEGHAWAECEQTAYVEQATMARLLRRNRVTASGKVGELPLIEEPLILHKGDRLLVTREHVPGRPARLGTGGQVLEPASIPCTLREVLSDVHVGHRVYFDDGKIGGVVQAAGQDHLEVEITQANWRGSRLGADKGINLPDSDLRLPTLSEKDQADLSFAAQHADIVGLSFVRGPKDVAALQSHLAKRKAENLGTVLKIETRAGFENLPRILLAGLRSPRLGVMIARGDLAVELGFERMAEVQEEILWVCEAAHVPVIWATQVLETLAKTGQPSRAEVTDAAMSGRAECVMLNKGPHIVEAVHFLSHVLQRMALHQQKKRAMLRRLSLSELEGGSEE